MQALHHIVTLPIIPMCIPVDCIITTCVTYLLYQCITICHCNYIANGSIFRFFTTNVCCWLYQSEHRQAEPSDNCASLDSS